MKKLIAPTYLLILTIAVVLYGTGCASSFHGHSEHNDKYAGVSPELINAYKTAENPNEKAFFADMIRRAAKGGKKFALLNALGIEILPVKIGLASDAHDHAVVQAGGVYAKEKLTDFKATTTSQNGGVDRTYGIGEKESDPDEDAIRATNENPLFKGLSAGLQAYLSGGLSTVFGDDGLSDVEKVNKAIETVEADEDAPEGALGELEALRDRLSE